MKNSTGGKAPRRSGSADVSTAVGIGEKFPAEGRDGRPRTFSYKMTVQYDGTRYNGWQRQGNTENTVQGKLENILTKMAGHRVEIHGSGRTDKGVHALAQVASFKLETSMSTAEIMEYVNRWLPEDIGVTALEETEERFHARLNARSKTYVYRIWNSGMPNVFGHRYMYTVKDAVDTEKMRLAAERLVGKHDYLGFSSLKKTKKSTVRTVSEIKTEVMGSEIHLTFTGDGFLYNSVRIMAGTILEVGAGLRESESIDRVFETKDRKFAGETLPAKGLTLVKVEY